MKFHTNLLLSVAWALLIFDENKVCCGIVIAQSSSESGTFCNGLRCPPGSNCMVSINVINGNRTSDTRCSNNYGEVVRQETITVSNGEKCIKNLTMMGEKVNVEQSCRNLSKAETDYMEQEKNNQKIQEAVQAELKQKQDVIEKQMHELERGIKNKLEDINRRLENQARIHKAQAEHMKAKLAEMNRQFKAMFG